jgi:hypothetical protein
LFLAKFSGRPQHFKAQNGQNPAGFGRHQRRLFGDVNLVEAAAILEVGGKRLVGTAEHFIDGEGLDRREERPSTSSACSASRGRR